MKTLRILPPVLAIALLLLALAVACSSGGGDDSRGTLGDDEGDDDDSADDDVIGDDDDNDDATDDDSTDDDGTDDDSTDDDAGDDDDDAGDDDDDSGDDDDDSGDDDDDSGDDDDDFVEYSGLVKDQLSSAAIQGATVELLNDVTAGSFDPPLTTVTGELGQFQIDAPDEVAVAAVKLTAADYPDTYFYHVAPSSTGSDAFGMYSDQGWAQYAAMVGETVVANKGQLAGRVQWEDAKRAPTAVGCATIALTPDSGTLYYGNAQGKPSTVRDSTHPQNGLFFVFNVNQGALSVESTADDAQLSWVAPKVFPGSLTVITITYGPPGFPTNPTPAGCQ